MANLNKVLRVNNINFNIVGDDKILPFEIIDITQKTNECCKKYDYLKGVKKHIY